MAPVEGVSQKSHDALISGDASIYRVVEVSSANPRIYFLTHEGTSIWSPNSGGLRSESRRATAGIP